MLQALCLHHKVYCEGVQTCTSGKANIEKIKKKRGNDDGSAYHKSNAFAHAQTYHKDDKEILNNDAGSLWTPVTITSLTLASVGALGGLAVMVIKAVSDCRIRRLHYAIYGTANGAGLGGGHG